MPHKKVATIFFLLLSTSTAFWFCGINHLNCLHHGFVSFHHFNLFHYFFSGKLKKTPWAKSFKREKKQKLFYFLWKKRREKNNNNSRAFPLMEENVFVLLPERKKVKQKKNRCEVWKRNKVFTFLWLSFYFFYFIILYMLMWRGRQLWWGEYHAISEVWVSSFLPPKCNLFKCQSVGERRWCVEKKSLAQTFMSTFIVCL